MYCELVMLVRLAYSRFSEYWRPPKTRFELATEYFYELVSSVPFKEVFGLHVLLAFFLLLTYLFFQKNVVDRLELNLKHKYISHLWGYPTLFETSTEIMVVPKVPPIIKFPLIKASGAQIEPFIAKDAVDRLEMNLKHQIISNFSGFPSPYEESLEMMIPKAPPLPPQMKTAGVKLEPLHLQRSADAFIPPPPKLIPSQLTLCPDCEIVFSGNELGFRESFALIVEILRAVTSCAGIDR